MNNQSCIESLTEVFSQTQHDHYDGALELHKKFLLDQFSLIRVVLKIDHIYVL